MDNQTKQNNEMDRQLGGTRQDNEDYGQRAPGRNPQDDQSSGQRTDRENQRIGEDEDGDPGRSAGLNE